MLILYMSISLLKLKNVWFVLTVSHRENSYNVLAKFVTFFLENSVFSKFLKINFGPNNNWNKVECIVFIHKL